MTIRPDLESLRRYWSFSAGYLRFVVAADLGDHVSRRDLEELTAGVEAELVAAGRPAPPVEGWVGTKDGWGAVMYDVHVTDDAVPWFERFCSAWGDDAQGQLVGGPPDSRPPRIAAPVFQAWLAYTTADLAAADPETRRRTWAVPAATTAELAHFVTTWAGPAGSRQFVRRVPDSWVAVTDPGVEGTVVEAVARTGAVAYATSAGRTRVRATSLRPQGLATFRVQDAKADWPAQVDLARRAVIALPEASDVGFVRRDDHPTSSWTAPVPTWRGIEASLVRVARPLLARYVPDVHGIQLLSRSHLDSASDLSRWRSTALPGDRFLVEARDLGPWYASAQPDADAVGQALSDFGAMVLTPETVRRENPWSSDDPSHQTVRHLTERDRSGD